MISIGMCHPFVMPSSKCFFFLLIFIMLFSSDRSHAARHKITRSSTSTSLVLGLTHSRAILPNSAYLKASSRGLRLNQLKPLDVVEPVREVRDGYLMSLNIGTPPQIIQVYVDTGSDLTWVPCGNLTFSCMDCDDYRTYRFMPNFSPTQSSSSIRDTCTSSFCADIHSSDNSYDPCAVAGCSITTLVNDNCPRPCPSFAYNYGEGGLVIGALTRDILRVHETSPRATRQIPGFCFGCVSSTYREPIGIAGFGRGNLSLLSQLGLLQKGFSHCFLPFKYANNPNITSPLIIGDLAISPTNNYLQFTPMLRSPLYPNSYYIGLKGITVGNSTNNEILELPLDLSVFDSQGNGGMLIDSGTTYTHLPKPFYSDLLSKLESMMSHPRSIEFEERTAFDLCYRLPCLNNRTNITDDKVLPSLSLHFTGNVTLTLPKENYFYAVAPPSNSSVVKCFLFQSMEDVDYGPAGVFGSFQQQNIKVVYDLEQERIGFQPMDCASD